MRYYIYISETKLEMLYEQIPLGKREKIASELNINLGIVRAKFRSEIVANANHQKILMVEKYLKHRISSVEKASPYVKGFTKASWGPFGDYSDVAYFGGSGDGTHIGLMGSMANCIGAANSEPSGYSLTGYIVHTLAKRKLLPPRAHTAFCKHLSAKKLNRTACEGVVMANQCSIEPQENIEFLARTVITHKADEDFSYNVYIGSPIYVALDDRNYDE